MMDARRLTKAQGGDPNAWADVKEDVAEWLAEENAQTAQHLNRTPEATEE